MPKDLRATAKILQGADLAREIRESARAEAAAFAAITGRTPHLRVLLAGNDPASETYVRAKTHAAAEAGLRAETRALPVDVAPDELLAEVDAANRDDDVDGILVQLPLPEGHDTRRVLDAVLARKDVDGVPPENVGLLQQGRPRFTPCTPAGILALLEANGISLPGRRAVVVGRSEIVGKPVAALLAARDATVTLAHSKTTDLPAVCREADVLVVAIGRPAFVTADFVRPGAVVVDVGVNRLTAERELPKALEGSASIREELRKKGRALVGDVAFEEVARIAGALTPVPGGVGPLTVAMLLKNTVLAAAIRLKK